MTGFRGPSGSTRSIKTTKVHIAMGVGGRAEITQLSSFFKELDEALLKTKQAVGNLTPIWKVVEDLIIDDINHLIESSGKNVRSSALRWKALNPKYKERKKAAIGDKPILVWSGAMKESIGIDRMTPNSMKLTARDPKARIHHFGGQVTSPSTKTGKSVTVTIPARPFMYMSSNTINAILQMLDGYTQQGLEGKTPRVKTHRQYLKRRR